MDKILLISHTGELRPHDSQGNVADGPHRGGAAVLGGQTVETYPEVGV